jgi:hypothetical protein
MELRPLRDQRRGLPVAPQGIHLLLRPRLRRLHQRPPGRIIEEPGPEENEDDRYDREERDEPPPRAASPRRDDDRFTAER